MPSGGGELTPVPAIPASVLAAFGTNVQFAASNMAVEWRAVRGTATSKKSLWQREIKESEEDSFAKASAKCKEVLIKARRSRQCAFMDCVTGLIIPGCEGEREKRSPLILSPGSCTRQGYPETTCSCACAALASRRWRCARQSRIRLRPKRCTRPITASRVTFLPPVEAPCPPRPTQPKRDGKPHLGFQWPSASQRCQTSVAGPARGKGPNPHMALNCRRARACSAAAAWGRWDATNRLGVGDFFFLLPQRTNNGFWARVSFLFLSCMQVFC